MAAPAQLCPPGQWHSPAAQPAISPRPGRAYSTVTFAKAPQQLFPHCQSIVAWRRATAHLPLVLDTALERTCGDHSPTSEPPGARSRWCATAHAHASLSRQHSLRPYRRACRTKAWGTPASNRWRCLQRLGRRRLRGLVLRCRERAEQHRRPFHQPQTPKFWLQEIVLKTCTWTCCAHSASLSCNVANLHLACVLCLVAEAVRGSSETQRVSHAHSIGS